MDDREHAFRIKGFNIPEGTTSYEPIPPPINSSLYIQGGRVHDYQRNVLSLPPLTDYLQLKAKEYLGLQEIKPTIIHEAAKYAEGLFEKVVPCLEKTAAILHDDYNDFVVVCLGRDAEIVYKVLQLREQQSRLLECSEKAMMEWNPRVENHQEVFLNYLRKIGLDPQAIVDEKSHQRYVLLDIGYYGSQLNLIRGFLSHCLATQREKNTLTTRVLLRLLFSNSSYIPGLLDTLNPNISVYLDELKRESSSKNDNRVEQISESKYGLRGIFNEPAAIQHYYYLTSREIEGRAVVRGRVIGYGSEGLIRDQDPKYSEPVNLLKVAGENYVLMSYFGRIE